MDWYEIKLRRKAVVRWISDHKPSIRMPSVSPGVLLLFLQILGCASVLYGISIYSHPLAFIIGGLTAIVIVERQSHEPRMTQEEILHNQRQIKLALSASEDPFAPPWNVPLTPSWVTYAASLRKQR